MLYELRNSFGLIIGSKIQKINRNISKNNLRRSVEDYFLILRIFQHVHE